jgi:ribonuclease-3
LTEAERLEKAAQLLGHDFARPELLREALTHRSAEMLRIAGRHRKTPKSTGGGSNERLEFIGDRVLGLVMAEWLAERFPSEQEGALGHRYAYLVSREAVAEVAERIGLTPVLVIGANEALAGVGRLSTVLADALEAGLGALYLDGGLPTAQRFIRDAWEPMMQAQVRPPKDPKTALQEVVLARTETLPAYRTVSRHGPSHAPHFVIEVTARGKTGVGEGGTKRMAERAAATDLLAKLS